MGVNASTDSAEAPSVQVHRDAAGGDLSASVSGPMTFATAAALVDQAPFDQGDSRCTVDLANVSVIDSAGLAVIIEWLALARRVDCSLRFSGASPRLQQLAELAGVDGHLTHI